MNEFLNSNLASSFDKVYKIRHSLAHVLAQAVKHLYPDVKLGIGPVIENGFYYDFLFSSPISEEDLEKIYQEMLNILSVNQEFVFFKLRKEEAIDKLNKENQPFKVEIAQEIKEEFLTFYMNGDFVDLCRGPHVDNTTEINPKAFKLTSISGAYWRGDSSREMMQRIYGVAFENEEELNNYLNLLEEAKKRDHRKIGRSLDLFIFSELVGAGLPLFTPRGAYIIEQLLNFSEELQLKSGFEKVFIPHLTKNYLYKVSGHWDKYKENLFIVHSNRNEEEMFVLKPMNCPHHIQIFSSKIRSYRELPIRYCESTTCYRDEKSGELLGLSRVRSLTQDDGHVFCREDQVVDELKNILNLIYKLYGILNLNFKARLSFRDPNEHEKYIGSPEEWDKVEDLLLNTVKEMNIEYFVARGEAAFYGPKIDIVVVDALGREWQCATQQVDYFLPQRFNLKYIDRDGTEKPVVMIHKALLGSVERFLSVYLEHTSGNLPLWLCYDKVIVLTVMDNERQSQYANNIKNTLISSNIRTLVDDSNDTLSNKIRKAQLEKIPYILVIGDREIYNNVVSVRLRNGNVLGMMKIDELIERINNEIINKV